MSSKTTGVIFRPPTPNEVIVDRTGCPNEYFWRFLDYIWQQSGGKDPIFGTKTTDDLKEGKKNLYYTQGRFDAAFKAKTTDDLKEGKKNLYYTDARVDARIALAAVKYVEKSANYTVSPNDRIINCTGGKFTVTLPTAVGRQGIQFIIKNSGTSTITVAPFAGQTVDGLATIPLPMQNQSVTIVSTGSNWIIV